MATATRFVPASFPVDRPAGLAHSVAPEMKVAVQKIKIKVPTGVVLALELENRWHVMRQMPKVTPVRKQEETPS